MILNGNVTLRGDVIFDVSKGGVIEIGEGTVIQHGVIIATYGGNIRIGKQCSVNPYCVLYGHGGLDIGNFVRIATHSVIIPADHIYSDTNTPIYLQGLRRQGVRISDDVWIGAGCKILDGVIISKGAVLAAGCVVTTDVEANSVYGGVPAKYIKKRGDA